jgi:hypothetical protein
VLLLVTVLAGALTGCTAQVAGAARPAPDASAQVCSWLSTATLQRAFGLSGLTAQRNGPILDHGVAAYLCVYSDTDGVNAAALETAVFPDSLISPTALVHNFAQSGVIGSDSPGVGDTSAFVTNLAGNANSALVAVRHTGRQLRLIALIVASAVDPAEGAMVSVLRGVFAELP